MIAINPEIRWSVPAKAEAERKLEGNVTPHITYVNSIPDK
jgi:hypothetical protein